MHDQHLLEVLDDAECRKFLASASIGRLGFTDRALPAIVPVPVALDGDRVIIPARRDDRVVGAVRGAVVALEVDSYRDEPGAGWSVTVVGPSTVVDRPPATARIERLGLFAGLHPGPECYIAVELGLVRGWRTARPRWAAASGADAAALL